MPTGAGTILSNLMKYNAKSKGQRKSIDRSRGHSNKPAFGKYASYKAVKELNAKRKKALLSLQDIASTVGRKRHAVWKWLNGLSRPAVEIRLTIHKEYGVAPSSWLTKDEERSIRESLQILNRKEKAGHKLTKPQQRTRKTLRDTLGIS